MLHVLLVILKVAGIVIVTILLILLLLLMLALFVPIRYKAFAKKDTEIYARAKVSWLLHIIYFSFYFEQNEIRQEFRIFGIPTDVLKKLVDKLKKFFAELKHIFQFKNIRNKNSKKLKRVKKSKKEILDININEEIKSTNQEIKSTESAKDAKSLDEKEKDLEKESVPKAISIEKSEKNRFSLKKWCLKIINKIKKTIQNIKAIWEKFIQTCKNIREKVSDIRLFLNDEGNKEAFRVCKEQFVIALKHVKPQKYKINAKFGTGDPALTGQILGILGMLMPLYKENGHFTPDFENVIFEGDIFLKGRVTLAKVLLIAWKLYRNENVKRCYGMIMD